MKKSLFSLALGTFALGISEFLMMGILGNIASALDVNITQADISYRHTLPVYVSERRPCCFSERLH